jgi:transposase
MKPYSKDLRIKVLDAVDRGMPREEVAEVFGVSVPSIKRWIKRRRETGDVEPKPIPGPLHANEQRWKLLYPTRSSSTRILPSMSIANSLKSTMM